MNQFVPLIISVRDIKLRFCPKVGVLLRIEAICRPLTLFFFFTNKFPVIKMKVVCL